MAQERKTGTGHDGDRPEGTQPKRKSQREDDRIREDAEAESSGDAPMDPADESFIESK